MSYINKNYNLKKIEEHRQYENGEKNY